ncbi:MAG TPA: prolyl oligopeptidase family serine peptidase [Jatrophihabitans sp.]|nr:prolyl oligopeptidase family serine peptidase [Jatrophihabitans sp.]
MATDSFPRLAARTMNFRLGHPRSFVVSPDGQRVVFLRAASGTSRSHALWVYDVGDDAERLVADPQKLLGDDQEELTSEERARRERLRVSSSGIVAFSVDKEVTVAAFALSSRLFVADLGTGAVRELPARAGVVDPQLDPAGRRVAYSVDRAVRVVTIESGRDELVVAPLPSEPVEVVWGRAEFVVSEELDRSRGFWWAPDGESLLVQRYDESPVRTWHIADPANPDRPPVQVRYPQAGTPNALVSLSVIFMDGRRVEVDWRSDRALGGHVLEYLVDVEWGAGIPVLTLLTRDQRRMEYRELDPSTGATSLLRAVTDDAWVELLPGTPRRLDDGRLLYSVDQDDTRRLWVDGAPVTPPDVLLRSVEAVEPDAVIATVIPAVGSVALARLPLSGGVELLSDAGGFATGAAGGGTVVIAQELPFAPTVNTTVTPAGGAPRALRTFAETSPLTPNARTVQVGARGIATTVLFPTGHTPGGQKLPVLLDPYGGPHGQRVVNAGRGYLTSQWFADQGFVVIVADGRGMAGRGPAWDRLAHHDRAGTIEDQVEALVEVAAMFPDDLDTARVAIRGWSFGGYLAALGVLRRPDVFAAAIAGAPTTDERLYDTCYSERYLGHPETDADVYEANSLLPLAAQLSRPLMIIHGLADDNVFVAHSLRLSSALLAAGRPHEVLPLSGATHLASDETVAENLLLLQVDFLRRALRLDAPGDAV